MAKITTVLETYNKSIDDGKFKNYDKIQIKLSKGNSLYEYGKFRDETNRIICTAPLTQPFKFSAKPEYSTFGDLVQKVDEFTPGGVGQVFNRIRGLGEAGAMSASRETYFGRIETAKLYKGVSGVSYSFDFICFEDLDRNGQPKKAGSADGDSILPFLAFSNMSFPNMPVDYMEKLTNMLGVSGDGFFEKAGSLLSSTGQSLLYMIQSGANGVSKFASTLFGGIDKDARFPSDVFAHCIDIKISNVCEMQNMVITGFDATFSKEILQNGLPVYVKYNLSVEPIVQPTNNEIQSRYFANLHNLAGLDTNALTNSVKVAESVQAAADTNGIGTEVQGNQS